MVPRVIFANLSLSIVSFSIVRRPPADIATSVDSESIFANIASSKLENVIFFSVPPSEKIKWSPCAKPVPPKALKESISTAAVTPVNPEPSPTNEPVIEEDAVMCPVTVIPFACTLNFSLLLM